MSMKLSQTGLDHLKRLEGVKLQAYQDSVGIWTIFVGLTTINNQPIKKGQTITMADGDKELAKQLVKYEDAVNQTIKRDLTQSQFDALVIFCFNIGVYAFQKSTLAKVVNENPNNLEGVKAELLKWVKAGGKVIEGLKSRRSQEFLIYSNKE